jgi:hypothetical protein
MPTYLVGPSRTYTTIAAAIAAIPSNLSGTGIHDVVIDAGVYTITSLIDTTGFSNPSASDYIHIRCASGSEHGGLFTAGVQLNKTNAFGTLGVLPEYSRITGIVITADAINGGGVTASRFSIIRDTLVRSGINGFCFSTTNQGVVTFINCLAVSGGGGSSSCFSISGANTFYNCGAYTLAGNAPYSTPSPLSGGAFVNCWAIRIGGGNGWNVAITTGSSNNASSGNDAPGTSPINAIDIDQANFISQATYNFHITKYSRYYNAGTNLSATFTEDFDNETVTGSWSIGPDIQVDSTACRTDSWDYTPLTSQGTFPWWLVRGSPSVSSNQITLTQDDSIRRQAFNDLNTGSRSWVASFQVRIPASSQGLAFTTGAQWQPGAARPLVVVSGGVVLAYGSIGSGSSAPFGAFTTPRTIVGATTASTLNISLYWRDVSRQIAMVVTFNGISYSSGFVQLTLPGIGNESQLDMETRASGIGGTAAIIGPLTWRADMTDAQVSLVYNGSVSLCGDLIPPTVYNTSSSPSNSTPAPHKDVPNARLVPSAKITPHSTPSPGRNDRGGPANDAKAPSLKSNKSNSINPDKGQGNGYKDGFLSVIPELGGYNAGTLGRGQRLAISYDDLEVRKRYVDYEVGASSRAFKGHTDLGERPQGGFTYSLKTNDSIPLFMSHFQKRYGTRLNNATTYYEFTPAFPGPIMSGSAFGQGTYGYGSYNAFTVSVYKAIYGTGYHFKSGLCDTIDFLFMPSGVAEVSADFRFATSSIVTTASMGSTGTYSTLPTLPLSTANIYFAGLPITSMQIHSNNHLKEVNTVGTEINRYRFGVHEVTGRVTVDLPKDSLAYIGSMLSNQAFSVYGTLSNSAMDRFVFQMPTCKLDYFDASIQNDIMEIPFRAYASEDGVTPPLKLMLWTQNYSATSFEPN